MTHLIGVARTIFVARGYRLTTMDEVAAAAGITKRTLYAWHQDKAALFRACVIAGAERFPALTPGNDSTVREALQHYVVALHNELTREDSFGMGVLTLRESAEFPDVVEAVQRGHLDYMIEPLACWLRGHGLEAQGETERTTLFVAMALSPMHNTMMVGLPPLAPVDVARHSVRCVALFLDGALHT
ncbi:TetR/AcrR family transcriptional regulator [Novosphingobium sp.]|uniref:TetR/AcrR family transcriptional regulator n=1 Tax=Novosphingobium sp. TaxID=1874826 RepID=UPI003D1001B3